MEFVDVTLSVDFDGDGVTDYTQTDTTDAAGNYGFDNLPAGEYTIAVDTGSAALDQYVLTGDPDSNPDSTSTVNLPVGDQTWIRISATRTAVHPPVPSATPSILMQTTTP